MDEEASDKYDTQLPQKPVVPFSTVSWKNEDKRRMKKKDEVGKEQKKTSEDEETDEVIEELRLGQKRGSTRSGSRTVDNTSITRSL